MASYVDATPEIMEKYTRYCEEVRRKINVEHRHAHAVVLRNFRSEIIKCARRATEPNAYKTPLSKKQMTYLEEYGAKQGSMYSNWGHRESPLRARAPRKMKG